MHRAEKASEDEIKLNHLLSLLEEYDELRSEKAKHYLNIDFAFGKDDTNDSDETTEQLCLRRFYLKNLLVIFQFIFTVLFCKLRHCRIRQQ